MTEPNDYQDFEADTLGIIKSIKRLPSMDANPKSIAWGSEYRSWTISKRLKYAERLASSMNHAADVLQTERKALSDIAKHQERQIVELTKRLELQSIVQKREMTRANDKKQELYDIISGLEARIKELEGGDYD